MMKFAFDGLFSIQIAAYGEIVGLLADSQVDTVDAIDLLETPPTTPPSL